jgi:hypothetical protein
MVPSAWSRFIRARLIVYHTGRTARARARCENPRPDLERHRAQVAPRLNNPVFVGVFRLASYEHRASPLDGSPLSSPRPSRPVAPRAAAGAADPAFSLASSHIATTKERPAFTLLFRRVTSLDFRVYRVDVR